MSTEIDDNFWTYLPEPILHSIFWYLPFKDILNAGKTCKRWNDAANDEVLWKKKFRFHYTPDRTVPLKPDAVSWKSECMRLQNNIPFVQAQRIEGHTNQVLHVSFSHNGEMFATCSKDGKVIVWNSAHPCTVKYSHDMKSYNWKYTQYSQFNRSDTLILVSGVHVGSSSSTLGEIFVFTVDEESKQHLPLPFTTFVFIQPWAIFNFLDESHFRCRVLNRPYDIFGTWFSDEYLLSGRLDWLAHLVSTTVLWIDKTYQEVDSEHVPIRKELYRFYNRNASSVRSILIARCPWLDDSNDPLLTDQNPENTQITDQMDGKADENTHKNAPIKTAAEVFQNEYSSSSSSADKSDDSGDKPTDLNDEYDEMENSIPKYLIFTTGSKTYTPHEVGFKRIGHVNFPQKLNPGPSLKERVAAKKAAQREPHVNPDWWDYESVAHLFDKVDKIIDLHGHIIGMALSPDHRYLYVNTRPWPENYVITNPLEPPPIAQEIDIHVIDLKTLTSVGNMLRSHKAYTSSIECFFIFLDVSNDYVSSGAEDMHAYLWDRYYRVCLAKYKHTDVVNSVAFNPRDSEMLVTTSDDYTIKVWRSRAKAKEYNIDNVNPAESVELKNSIY